MTEPPLDSVTMVNAFFMLFCTALLPLVVIGIAFFYSGLTQRRSSMTMFTLPILLAPVIFIDWFIWGYSLCYGSSGNRFIGNLKFAVLRQLRDPEEAIYSTSRGDILSINHILFNGMFKIICAAITFPGCVAERGRIIPMFVFLFFWSCIIFNPVSYWFWNRNGWLSIELDKLPVLDFAGGTCIHVVSGFTALAYSYILGPRNPKILYDYRNSNTGFIVIGTFFVMCGWVGFITGCDFNFSPTSLYITTNTVLCAFVSGIVWAAIDYYYSVIPLDGSASNDQTISSAASVTYNLAPHISQTGVQINQHLHDTKENNFIQKRKLSMISFSSGLMTGLVVITPAGGYTASGSDFWKPFVFGVVGAVVGNLSTRLKYYLNIDDALDIFAIHGIAGILGSLLTGIFANDRYDSPGGWVQGHWIQFAYQLLGSVVVGAYVFVLTCIFLYIIDLIPGLHLRIDKDFNRRIREQSTPKDNESNISPTSNGLSYFEKVEILGTDTYEFNGEFMMDFMEFIKYINPSDYPNEDIFEAVERLDSSHVPVSDFELHSTSNLTKRE